MKITLRIFFLISIIFFIAIALKLLDTYTSLKYEVDEPRAMNKVGEALNEREKYLKDLIAWLWINLSYVGLAIVLSVRTLSGKRG